MRKYLNLTCIVIGLSLIYFSCKKNETVQVPEPDNYKIEIVRGNNQSDTIGNVLKDSIVFKATNKGDTLSLGYVLIETSDCEGNKLVTEFEVGKRTFPLFALFVKYQWRLNGITGSQNLKAVLLDSAKNRRDSVTVNAQSKLPAKGWYVSGCVGMTNFSRSFCQITSGRIFSVMHQKEYPYFTDDEAITWKPLTSFPEKGNLVKCIATPEDEVFITVNQKGVFYSSDKGQTWQNRSSGLPLNYFHGDLWRTKSGKLFTHTFSGIFKSDDKGLSWHEVTYGLKYYTSFSHPVSTSDNRMYVIHGSDVLISTDGGENWRSVNTLGWASVFGSLFVDDNNEIYLAVSGSFSFPRGLYVSKDNAQTWQLVYASQIIPGFDQRITEISKHNGSYYFYATEKNILTRTSDFSSYSIIQPPSVSPDSRVSHRYLVTKNGQYLISTESFGMHYFIR